MIISQDFWELKDVPGYFGCRNDAAQWLQDHREDPYWMAHQLNNANSQDGYDHFEEYWKLARETHGYAVSSGDYE